MKERKRAYICSPLSAPTRQGIQLNMQKAREYMWIIENQYGYRTYAPHAYLPELLDDQCQEERALGLSFGMEILKLCQVLIICGNRVSEGMCREIEAAAKLGLEIYSCSPQHAYRMVLITDGRRADEMQI